MGLSEIQQKISNAPALDFGDIFNNTIELFKKSWLYGLLLQLFILIILMPFMIVIYVPFVMSIIAQSKSGQVDPDVFGSLFAEFTVFYLVIFILGILAATVFQLALQAAFFRIIKHIDEGKEVKVSDLFYFLKGRYFGKVTLLMIATILVSGIAAILAFVLAIPTFFLSFLVFIYLIIPTSFFVICYSFNPEMNIVDIVKCSFFLGTKKWLISFSLFFITYLLVVLLTLITCGIGSLFLSPFVYLPLYFVYKQVIGFDGGDEVDTMEEKEVF